MDNLNGVPDLSERLRADAKISPQGRGNLIMFSKKDIISTYTTKEAVSDGTLVKIENGMPEETGIRFPVYMTRATWDRYVEPPKELPSQDEQGRLWDILYMFALNARLEQSNIMKFKLIVMFPDTTWLPNEKRQSDLGKQYREVELKAVITAQDIDDPSPAIFIMLPTED